MLAAPAEASDGGTAPKPSASALRARVPAHVLALVLAHVVLLLGSASAQTNYERVFYPKGVPLRHVEWTDGTRTVEYGRGVPTFELIAQTAIPNSRFSAVLFAERIKGGFDSDWFALFWGIAHRSTASGRMEAVARGNASHYLIESDTPDADHVRARLLVGVTGGLNTFAITNHVVGIRLHASGRISGNGAISGGSDGILTLDKETGEVGTALELIGTHSFWKGGPDFSATGTEVFLVRGSRANPPDIVVWSSKTEGDKFEVEKAKTIWAKEIPVYRYPMASTHQTEQSIECRWEQSGSREGRRSLTDYL